jgi:DNA repair protein RadA/Sms
MKTKQIWECDACGHSEAKWMGCCKQCGSWNTFKEQIAKKVTKVPSGKPISLSEIQEVVFPRTSSNLPELDSLLGGGVVVGSVILIGGAPGIGKSTLLLQLANQFADKGSVLYVCAEESEAQTSLRAKRLGVCSKNLYLLHSNSLLDIRAQIEFMQPKVVVIDSLQLMSHEEIPSSPGSLVQVREAAHLLTELAKRKKITLFLVTHVTKTGEIAGPKVVEHLVDVVLEFEGDKAHGFRMLRSQKNRFGPTHEMILFDMREKGLVEVDNPSKYFLSERAANSPGCAAVCTKEGGRAFLLEVQALVTNTFYPSPMRKAAGIDTNRLSLLLAVLEKKVGYSLHGCDVFVSLIGGLKVVEPAIDLGIVLAIASSFLSKVIDPHTLIIGEVGLAGEIRSVPFLESRIKEAEMMGFTRIVYPKRSSNICQNLNTKCKLIAVEWVEEAVRLLF